MDINGIDQARSSQRTNISSLNGRPTLKGQTKIEGVKSTEAPIKEPDPSRSSNFWSRSNTSYSGSDITALINLNGKFLHIGNLASLSYSVHREKSPVRTLGRIYPKTYVRGPLTIAGSLIFTVFNTHVLSELRDVFDHEHNISDLQKTLLPHQFPPFDILVTYANEYGHTSYLRLYGIDIVDEGQTHSVNDMISENMMQYVAKDMDLMLSTENGLSHAQLTMSQALFTNDRTNNQTAIDVKNREELKRQLFEFNRYLSLLEAEVTKWETNVAKNYDWDPQYLNIYKIGNITTLDNARRFLSDARINYKELKALVEAYAVTHNGFNERRDNPFDYSVGGNTQQ